MTRRPGHALLLAFLAITVAGPSAYAAELDPAVLTYKQPADFTWRDSTTYPGLKNAVLYGDPSKPGPYVVRNRFAPGTFSKPHFHPNDRFIVVVSGTWWIGTGEKFDPDSTKPMPAGSFVLNYGVRSTTTVPRTRNARSSFTAWARRQARASARSSLLSSQRRTISGDVGHQHCVVDRVRRHRAAHVPQEYLSPIPSEVIMPLAGRTARWAPTK